MVSYDFVPASELSVSSLLSALNEGYAEYKAGIEWTQGILLRMIRELSVDLTVSPCIVQEDRAVACALVGRRGRRVRLSAFCVAPSARFQGVGQALLAEVVTAAKQRDDAHIELEVIADNWPALKLYQKAGFQVIDDLVGSALPPYVAPETGAAPAPVMRSVSLEEATLACLGAEDVSLPWQIAPQSVALKTSVEAFALDHAWAVFSPLEERLLIWSLYVLPTARRQGLGHTLITSIRRRYPDCSIVFHPLFPRALYGAFLSSLGPLLPLEQRHMWLELDAR